MRLIILAAGQGFKLDGFNKLLIRDPRTKETILEKYLRLFKGYEVSVVVGYNAISVMSLYPELHYIYNGQWRITGNSYSLCLALDERPCIVLSADLVFDEDFVSLIEKSPPNSVVVYHSENKGLNTVRCNVRDSVVQSMYMGVGYNSDPETTGVYKISSPLVLRQWKKNCLSNQSVFAGLNLPVDLESIHAVDTSRLFFSEINTPIDYLNLINKAKSRATR